MADGGFPEQYAHLEQLIKALWKEFPGPMGGFGQLHQKSLVDGALAKKTKELIALAIGITAHCDGCIAYHVHDALKAGATRPEVLETIGVAIMMGGGPALIYGAEAYEALGQFEATTR